MSKSITLICPQSIDVDSIKSVLEVKFSDLRIINRSNECYIDTNFQGENENQSKYVSISIDKALDYIAIDDYLDFDNVSEEFKEELIESNFIHISYNCIAFCQDILKEILSSFEDLIKKIWVDNDYGKIIPGNIILDELKNDSQSFSLSP